MGLGVAPSADDGQGAPNPNKILPLFGSRY
jgi:hypothetical protein